MPTKVTRATLGPRGRNISTLPGVPATRYQLAVAEQQYVTEYDDPDGRYFYLKRRKPPPPHV